MSNDVAPGGTSGPRAGSVAYPVMQTLTGRAANAAWWSTLEIAARYGVQFVVTLVLARLLTPADFGLLAMLLVFTSIGALLVDSGFGTALIQRQHTSADDETTVFIFTIAVGALTAAALWMAAPMIAHFYAQPQLTALTRVMALVLPLGALAAVPDALLTMKLRFKPRAMAEIVASIASAIVAIMLAWQGFGVWSLAWQAIVLLGMRALLLWLYSGWRPRGRFRLQSFRSLFGFGSYMLMSGLLDTISVRLQSLLIGKLFDSRALGYYTLAQNTQQVPTSFMSNVLIRVGLPVFSTVADEPDKLLAALRLSLRTAMFLFLPCMLGIAVIAKPLLGMLYGSRWEPAAPLLSVLALSAALWPLHVLNLAALNAQGRSDLFFRLAVIKKTLAIVLIFLGSIGGPLGIAWSVLAANLVAVAINAYYSGKFLGYGVSAQLADQMGTFALSLLAAGMGWLVMHALVSGFAATLLAVIAAAACYFGAAALARHTALTTLLSLLHSLRPASASSAGRKHEV